MNEAYQSLSHSRWDCKYHVVFVPKRRRQALFGNIRRKLGGVFHELARQKECRIVQGHLLPDHVHMCVEIPPKHAVASIVGFLKGKSAIAIARESGKDRTFTGEHFWARGYAVSTVGFSLAPAQDRSRVGCAKHLHCSAARMLPGDQCQSAIHYSDRQDSL
jgi:putative transposase